MSTHTPVPAPQLNPWNIPGVLTVGRPAGVRDADRVAGVVGRVGLQELHAVRGVALGSELGHHQLPVVVYGGHAGRVVAAIPQDGQALGESSIKRRRINTKDSERYTYGCGDK